MRRCEFLDHRDSQRVSQRLTEKDCQNKGTADFADWSRLGAGYRRQDCQNNWLSQRTQRTQRRRRWGGPCVRVKRTSGPGACRGMAGFARHALVFGKSSGDSRRPICPIGPIGPTAACSGDAGDSGDTGWRLAPLCTTACLSRACRAFCSLWPWKVWPFGPARSVLRGASAPLVPRPLRPFVSLWKGAFSGAEKPPLQSANQPISQSAGRSDGAPVSSWRRVASLCLRPYATASSCNLTFCLAGGCAILWT